MAVTATVIEDAPQAGGVRRVRVRYDETGGAQAIRGPMFLDTGVDAQVVADSFIPRYETAFKAREYEDAIHRYFQGEDMDALHASGHFSIITQDEMRQKCLTRAANVAQQSPLTAGAAEDLGRASVWTNNLSPAVLSANLTNAASTWTNAEANSFANAMETIKVAIDNIDHGKGKQEEPEA